MTRHKLDNYLLSHRKRTGLSQQEVAFLLACKSGSKVYNYERFIRRPSLENVLAYEVIFGVPPRTLFAGPYEKVEQKTKKRAELLARHLNGVKSELPKARKLQALRAVYAGSGTQPV